MADVASWQIPRVKAHGVARAAFASFVLLQFYAINNFQANADDGTFDDFPFLIHCEISGLHRAFYLSTISPDGVAVYISPDRQAGTITIRGKAEPVGVDGSGNCAGKTLEQLRSTDQAYDLQH